MVVGIEDGSGYEPLQNFGIQIMETLASPSLEKESFVCPHCGAFSHHDWWSLMSFTEKDFLSRLVITSKIPEHEYDENIILHHLSEICRQRLIFFEPVDSVGRDMDKRRWVFNLNLSECFSCKNVTLWVHDKVVFPETSGAPMPNNDLSDDIKAVYNEARSIIEKSPRGAAALLRLCIQLLCRDLGEKGENINEDIANLVKNGLDPKIQRALDIVRVIGNNAVHPGKIEFNDDRSVAISLFTLVNFIAHRMITEPREVEALCLPQSNINAIDKRDTKP